MNFQIQPSEQSDWLNVGSWFDSFIDLGQKLHTAKRQGAGYKRVLLSVPQSEMISLAIAIGFSRSTYLAEGNLAEELEIDEVSEGDLIQLRSTWIQTPGKIEAPANIVGLVHSIDRSSPNEIVIRFSFNSTGLQEPRKIMRFKCPTGKKDPLQHIRLYRVPLGTPQRPGKTPREFERTKTTSEELQNWVNKWENWEYQIDPTLLVFGSPTKLQDYGRPNFRDNDLHKTLLQIDHDKMLNVARLDSLSNDLKPHFVNAIEQTSNFPKKGSPTFDSLLQFPFVCLDGNAAVASLSDKNVLDDKCVIGLWETSKPNLQDLALNNFVANATRYKPIDNFEGQIPWTPPVGVQAWGWH